MSRDYRLVRYLGEWQVCSKASRRTSQGQIRIVWISGKERLVFCDVGKEDRALQLPEEERQNFFGDRFTFAIDEVDSQGKTTEKLAGVDEYLHHLNPQTLLQLRHGGRIIRQEHGLGNAREWITRRRQD